MSDVGDLNGLPSRESRTSSSSARGTFVVISSESYDQDVLRSLADGLVRV